MLNIVAIGMTIGAITFGFSSASAAERKKSDPPTEFEFSDSEKREVTEFLYSIKTSDTFDLGAVIDVALNGNPVALYISGQCSLSGTGTAINRKVANQEFKMAASLGYAPALFEIFSMYIDELRDPLLALVYLNLTISFGHKEYRDFYYEQIALVSNLAGPRVVHEIERIALEKMAKILEIKKDIESRKDTYKPALTLVARNVTSDDCIYGENYWKSFFKSEDLWKQFFGVDVEKTIE